MRTSPPTPDTRWLRRSCCRRLVGVDEVGKIVGAAVKPVQEGQALHGDTDCGCVSLEFACAMVEEWAGKLVGEPAVVDLGLVGVPLFTLA